MVVSGKPPKFIYVNIFSVELGQLLDRWVTILLVVVLNFEKIVSSRGIEIIS